MKDATEWASRVYALPQFTQVMGNVRMCSKPLKPICVADPKKEEKKEAPKPVVKAEKKVEEKKKDNVESLPPSAFNVYDFKTFYVNHADKKGEAVDEWYKMLDWEGWSFWFFHYDKYDGEGVQLHVTNNLMNGFLSRAEHVSKYTFARHGVFGEEPNLEIMGVWLLRG
jgi:elongation factor 1-gamma